MGILTLCTPKGIAEVNESLAWTAQLCPCPVGWPGLYHRLRPKSALRAAKASSEFVALPAGSGEVVVVMDPEPERSAEEILDDCSQPSYPEKESLSEASNVPLSSRKRKKTSLIGHKAAYSNASRRQSSLLLAV